MSCNVVKYPHSCCKAIAFVIAQVTGDRSYLNHLQAIPDLSPEPMWTIKQAKKWVKEDYRKTYSQSSPIHFQVRSHVTPTMIREEDKIVEIRNKAVYARRATSPDKSQWAKEPEVLFGS